MVNGTSALLGSRKKSTIFFIFVIWIGTSKVSFQIYLVSGTNLYYNFNNLPTPKGQEKVAGAGPFGSFKVLWSYISVKKPSLLSTIMIRRSKKYFDGIVLVIITSSLWSFRWCFSANITVNGLPFNGKIVNFQKLQLGLH